MARRTRQGTRASRTAARSLGNQTNALAILSLVFGIAFFIPFAPILAIVFGFIALSQMRVTGEQGKGLAIAGIILGFFWILIFIVVILFFITFITSLVTISAPSTISQNITRL